MLTAIASKASKRRWEMSSTALRSSHHAIPTIFLLVARRLRTDKRNAHKIGGARRAEWDAGDDDDALAGLGKTFLEGEAAGALDHVVLIVGVFVDHAVDAPDHRQPSPGAFDRRNGDDGTLRPLPRHPHPGRAG